MKGSEWKCPKIWQTFSYQHSVKLMHLEKKKKKRRSITGKYFRTVYHRLFNSELSHEYFRTCSYIMQAYDLYFSDDLLNLDNLVKLSLNKITHEFIKQISRNVFNLLFVPFFDEEGQLKLSLSWNKSWVTLPIWNNLWPKIQWKTYIFKTTVVKEYLFFVLLKKNQIPALYSNRKN